MKMSINKVFATGNLTRNGELRETPSGMKVLTFGLAINDRFYNKETKQYEDRPNFVDCSLFGSRAESLHKYLTKGTKVAIDGKLRWSQWEREGEKRSKIEIIVDGLEFMNTPKPTSDAPTPKEEPIPFYCER